MAYGNNLFGLIALACAVWVVYDVWTKNTKLSEGMKILWTVLGIVFNVLAAIVYYFMYKR